MATNTSKMCVCLLPLLLLLLLFSCSPAHPVELAHPIGASVVVVCFSTESIVYLSCALIVYAFCILRFIHRQASNESYIRQTRSNSKGNTQAQAKKTRANISSGSNMHSSVQRNYCAKLSLVLLLSLALSLSLKVPTAK